MKALLRRQLNVAPFIDFMQFDIRNAKFLRAPLSIGSAMDTCQQKRLPVLKRAFNYFRFISAQDLLIP